MCTTCHPGKRIEWPQSGNEARRRVDGWNMLWMTTDTSPAESARSKKSTPPQYGDRNSRLRGA